MSPVFFNNSPQRKVEVGSLAELRARHFRLVWLAVNPRDPMCLPPVLGYRKHQTHPAFMGSRGLSYGSHPQSKGLYLLRHFPPTPSWS